MKGEDAAKLKALKELRLGKREIVPQDARWGLVEMCGARRSPKKVEGSA